MSIVPATTGGIHENAIAFFSADKCTRRVGGGHNIMPTHIFDYNYILKLSIK